MIVSRVRFLELLSALPDAALSEITKTLDALPPPLPSNESSFRRWTKLRREAGDLSQAALAREIGVRSEQISRFENGSHPLNETHLESISRYFAKSS